jgi:hypothetical protein
LYPVLSTVKTVGASIPTHSNLMTAEL